MNTKDMIMNALLIALIAIMASVPQLGFILFLGVPLTLIHLPVIIGSLLFRRYAWMYGLTFGLASFWVALSRPVTPVDVLFQNPLVSVAPRLLFAILIPVLITAVQRTPLPQSLHVATTAFAATLLHAVLVLSMVAVFGLELLGGSTVVLQVIGGILLANSLPEAVLAVLVVTPIVRRLYAFVD
jgi:hypothetical protein